MNLIKTIALSFVAALLYAQVTGLPTNLDKHPGMRMSNVDGATGVMPAYPTKSIMAPKVVAPGTSVLVARRGYDNNASGANTQETVLTPANVGGLHKLFSHILPGDARGIEAQPLIIPKVTMASGDVYDIALYATMANDVYAFDAHSEQLLWGVHLAKQIPGSTQIDGYLLNDGWGILSTPVYDPDTQTVYLVTWSDPNGNWQTAAHTLHALSVVDGHHVVPALSLMNVSYSPGNGLPAQLFKNSERKQRASLALATIGGKKVVFVSFGTIQETSANARGWVIAYDVASNSVSAAWTATSRYSGGGIWAAGAGPVVDAANGNLYFLTGNGSFDGITDWGECFIKLHYTPPTVTSKLMHAVGLATTAGSLQVTDWWSPWSDAARASGSLTGTHLTTNNGWDDEDLGSGGPAFIPAFNFLIGSGKDGIAYVLDAANMGKTKPADFANSAANYAKAKWIGWLTYYQPASPTPANPTDLNVLYGQRTHHNHSQPVWFSDNAETARLFIGGENGNVRSWDVRADGLHYVACSQEYASNGINYAPGGMAGSFLTISSNGKNNGLVWAAMPIGDVNKTITQGNLVVYDASNFGTYSDGSGAMKLLWKSPDYTINKFNLPVISGGYVFLPRYDGAVDIYGLN